VSKNFWDGTHLHFTVIWLIAYKAEDEFFYAFIIQSSRWTRCQISQIVKMLFSLYNITVTEHESNGSF